MRCSILGETNLAVLITDRSQNLEANQSAHFMERDLILVDADWFNADASSPLPMVGSSTRFAFVFAWNIQSWRRPKCCCRAFQYSALDYIDCEGCQPDFLILVDSD